MAGWLKRFRLGAALRSFVTQRAGPARPAEPPRATRKRLWALVQTRPAPIPIVRGEGVYLYTEDGRRLLDGTSSWWVNIHGHAHPAVCEQHGPHHQPRVHLVAVRRRAAAHDPGRT